MHEMSLTQEFVDAVLDEATRIGAKSVRRVYLSIGEGRDFLDEFFRAYFRRLARDTIAEDAELVVNRVPFRVRCRDCGHIFPINLLDQTTWKCTRCASADYELFSGMELGIDYIEVV